MLQNVLPDVLKRTKSADIHVHTWPLLAAMSAPLVRQGSGTNLYRSTFTDPGVDVSDLAGSLSPFQIEKLTYLFKCLDQNGSGIFDVRINTMELSC